MDPGAEAGLEAVTEAGQIDGGAATACFRIDNVPTSDDRRGTENLQESLRGECPLPVKAGCAGALGESSDVDDDLIGSTQSLVESTSLHVA
jgi:hypothetical protein